MIIENDLIDDNEPTTSSLISEILKKYKLEEDPAAAARMIMEGSNLPNSIVVQLLSKKFADGLIAEKDFADSLADKLKISGEVAENIVKDIKEKVVPYIQSVSKNKIAVKKPATIVPTKIEPPVESKIPKKLPESRPKITKSSGKLDSYREPIE